MSFIWKQNTEYIVFDPEVHSIGDVCGSNWEKFLPYKTIFSPTSTSEVWELIEAAKKNHWRVLDLSDFELTEMPDELWDLTDLRILRLGTRQTEENRQQKYKSFIIPNEIERLRNLQVLRLGGYPRVIKKDGPLNLPELLYLDAFNCEFSQLPDALMIPSIEALGFSCLDSSLALGFLSLRNLKELHLSSSKITSLPDDLSFLQNLEILNLNRTSITSLEKSIDCLQNLKSLILYKSQISALPNSIERLQNLETLDLSETLIKTLPDTIGNLRNLKRLDLSGVQITSLPDYIERLENLEVLDLSESSIKTLPDTIGSLQSLKRLDLSETQIKTLPSSISEIEALTHLRIKNTPLAESLPPEILTQSARDIIRLILSQQSFAPKEFFNESKLIVVGQGHVGKTCLVKRLVENKYMEEPSTEGIDKSKWEYNWKGFETRLNIWDFGGQEIYHSTHQFFLTKRSLYLLVWDALAEKEYGRIDYWLRTIQSLADDSPIIIVVNKCDSGIGRIDRIDEKEYKERYPQIVTIFYVSCKDGRYIGQLKRQIKETAKSLPLMRMTWLTSWMNVRKRIERLAQKRDSISYLNYLQICKENGITDEEEAVSLIKYLHDLGIVLFYHDDPLLKNIVILSSEWGTDAVYKVIDEQERRLRGRNGILKTEDLPFIWKNQEKYPREYYLHLLNLMEKFQLAFRIDQETYLVAELLNNESIDLDLNFGTSNTLSFRYEYDFLPAGVMTKFIVSANHYLETRNGVKQCWKKGAYLRHNSACALVRLFDGISERYIQIDVNGNDPREKRELLSIIRFKLDEINNRFNKIRISHKIPCCCSEKCQYLFDYQYLLRAEKKGKKTVECQYSLEDVSLSKLLDGVEEDQKHNEYYNLYTFFTKAGKQKEKIEPIHISEISENKSSIDQTISEDDSKERNINRQLFSWAQTSDLYKEIAGESDQRLKKALCGDESDRILFSYELMKHIWENHTDWGLMPDYSLLANYEHSGKFYQKYRDHFSHMFKVFLLGLYFYEKSETISDAFSKKDFDMAHFISVWSIAALYHDIGYIFDTLDGKIDSVNTQEVCKELLRILHFPLSKMLPGQFTENRENEMQTEYRTFVQNRCVFSHLTNQLSVFSGFGSSVRLRPNQKANNNPIETYFNMVSTPNETRAYFDHGISSAMILLYMQDELNKYIKEMDDRISREGISEDDQNSILAKNLEEIKRIHSRSDTMWQYAREAAIALAVHNITCQHSKDFIQNLNVKGVSIEYFQIPLKEEPLSYLLRLCDELQCWDRPYLASPIVTGNYLKGDKVHIETKDGQVFVSVDDDIAREKIKEAMGSIIEPPIETWLTEK